MQFASALSRDKNTSAAVDEVCRACRQQLTGRADLVVVFCSSHHVGVANELIDRVAAQLEPGCLVGGTAESLVGVRTEVEMEPALSVWVAELPEVELLPMHLEFTRTPEGGSFVGWPDELIDTWPEGATLLLIGDPFSFPADVLLERLNDDRGGVPVVGGMCSAGQQPGFNRLFLDDRALTTGAVGVVLHGNLQANTVVSQGCRPIGEPFVITRAEQNVIHELGGLPAYKQLEKVFHTLPTHDQRLMQQGLHLGRVVSEYLDHFEQGDFLIRNVVGADPDTGSIAIGDFVRPGQTVQFQVRDAETADAEFRQLLAQAKNSMHPAAGGGLLFTCNGRGTRLFPESHHDAAAVADSLGPIPLAGFFAAGELGPVGGKNFLHGFTASLLLLAPK